MNKKNSRIRQLLNDELKDSTDTQELIQRFQRAHVNDVPRERSQLESTDDILNTEIPIVRPDDDFSQSTHIIRNNSLFSAPKRPVSGSSMDVLPSFDEIQKSNDHEIDLDLIYKLIDSRLPNNATSFHFKSILSKYVDIINSHGDNASADKFLITIYNQLRRSNTSMPKLYKIIDTFIESPANLEMKLANYVHFQEQREKANFFKLWIIKRRKFHQIAKSEKIWELYLKKKFLSKFILAYDIVTDGYEENAAAFRETQLTIKSWDAWRTNFVSLAGLESIADDTQKKKFLQVWQEKLINDYEIAGSLYEKTLLEQSFRGWKLKKRYNQFKPIVKYFMQWKATTTQVRDLEEDAKQLEMVFHAGFFFSKWKKQSSMNLTRLTELNDLCGGFIMKKFMKIWRNALSLKVCENRIIVKRDELIIKFALQQWKRRLSHEIQLAEYDKQKDIQLLKSSVTKWKSALSLVSTSEELESRLLIKRFFNRWRLSSLSSQYQAVKEYNSASKSFQHWLKETRVRRSLKAFQQQKVTTKFWELWMLKHIKQQNALELSEEALHSFTKLIFLNNWKRVMKVNYDNEQIAGTHLKKKFLAIIANEFNKIKEFDVAADKFYDEKGSSIIIKRLFKNWKKKYAEQVKEKLNTRLEDYQQVNALDRKGRVFKKWLDRYRSYISQEEMYIQDFVHKRLSRSIFDKWVGKYEEVKELEIQADQVNYLNLLSTGFIKLQLKYQHIQILEERLRELQEDKDVEIILKFLKKWTYKNLQIDKNNEILKFFNKRWERAHLRAIVSLWKNKTTEKLGEKEESDYDNNSAISISPLKIDPTTSRPPVFNKLEYEVSEFDDDDDDDEDDDSPTKFKSKLQRRSLSRLTQTPRKALISPSKEFQSTGGIPGSERIKKKRLEALRNHYNQIKYAIPSPIDFKKVNTMRTDPDKTDELQISQQSIFNSGKKGQEKQIFDEPLTSPVVLRRNHAGHGSTNIRDTYR